MYLNGFYFITDRKLSSKPDVEAINDAFDGGCRVFQYREKELSTRIMIENVNKIKEILDGEGILLINDRVDVAVAADCDGVHLGQDDMSLKDARKILGEKIIGITVHDVDEALAAYEGGADYLGISPIFSTTTKLDAGEPAGIQLIKDVKKAVDLPCAAIGGINEQNVDSVIEAGADMVCAISATVAKSDIIQAVKYFTGKFNDEST